MALLKRRFKATTTPNRALPSRSTELGSGTPDSVELPLQVGLMSIELPPLGVEAPAARDLGLGPSAGLQKFAYGQSPLADERGSVLSASCTEPRP